MPFVIQERQLPDFYKFIVNRNLLWQYDFLLQSIQIALDHMVASAPRFTGGLVLSLNHFAVVNLAEDPGRFRSDFVHIQGSEHEPPFHDQVPKLFGDLVVAVNRQWQTADALELAAYVLWRLTWLHPFNDGNGRTARAACYYVLCAKLGQQLPGRNIITQQIRENPAPYYEALRHADRTELAGAVDLRPLKSVLETALYKQLQS